MSYLKKSDRLELQAEWLDVWRQMGSPQLNKIDERHADRNLSPFRVRVVGDVRQLYGYASRMCIWLGETDITELLASLAPFRLCKGGTIIFRSGAGEEWDKHRLAHSAYNAHMAAAEAHKDVEAIRAGDELRAIEVEAALLAATMKCNQVKGRRLSL